jgi:proline dehydrogenase
VIDPSYSRPLRFLLQRAGRAYTTGPEIENALVVCEEYAAQGIAGTICYWNSLLDSPACVLNAYLRIIQLIPRLQNDCYLSIKAPALKFEVDLLKEIVREAERANIAVHFDAMAPETVDRTLALIEKIRGIYPNVGYTLPARWRRSLEDSDRIIEMGLRVRLVKGQWHGLNGDETDSGDGFLRLTERLIAKSACHVAVATHNKRVARNTFARLRDSGIPHELELLYGMPQRGMLKFARQHSVATRVYVPYGHSGMPYRLKEAGRDPRVLVWFMRDLIRT